MRCRMKDVCCLINQAKKIFKQNGFRQIQSYDYMTTGMKQFEVMLIAYSHKDSDLKISLQIDIHQDEITLTVINTSMVAAGVKKQSIEWGNLTSQLEQMVEECEYSALSLHIPLSTAIEISDDNFFRKHNSRKAPRKKTS